MLCDIAARKLTPDDGNGSRSPCLSPRRFKKPTRNSTGYSQNSGMLIAMLSLFHFFYICFS